MADNVPFQSTPATPASGTIVSTEEVTTLNGGVVSAQHVQRVAAAIRTADGTAIDLPGDATNGLDIDVTRLPTLPAGTNNIGDVDIASLPNEGQQNMAGSISVAVASDQTAIPVSGPLTDAQLRASAVPVSGTLGVSGNVEVVNDVGNPLPVSASSLPLPTGASSSANQSTIIGHLDGVEASLSSIDGKIPVSPATAGNQTTGNTSLSSIDGKLATAKTGDFDTGVGTDTVSMQGIALPAPGGAVVGGTPSDPLRVDPTGTTTQPVSAASLPLPTGAATSANQSTANSALSAIQTAVELIDNTVSGAEMQVDVVGPLPAGTNAIGKLAANDGVDIGDVTVNNAAGAAAVNVQDGGNSLTVDAPVGTPVNVQLGDGTRTATVRDTGTSDSLNVAITDGSGNQITAFGGGTQYDEDTASSPADKLTMAGVVRKDSAASLVDTDGERTQLQVDASGALRVTGGGGGTEYTEDIAAPVDPVGATFMMTRDDQLSTVTEAEGDWSRLRGTSKGALWVTIPDVNGDPVTSFGGGTQYTEDAAAAANPTGTALNLIRKDTLASEVDTDGDNVAARGTAKGELYVKHVDSVPVTGPLTDAELRASAVTVFQSGVATASNQATGNATLASIETQAVNQTTALQLIDDTVYTDGTGSPSKAIGVAGSDGTNPQIIKTDTDGELQVDVLTSAPSTNQAANGTLTAAAQVVTINTSGVGTVALQITGTWTGILVFEATVDDANYFGASAFAVGGTAASSSTTTNGQWFIPSAGFKKVRMRAQSLSSGTANIFMEGSAGISFLVPRANTTINVSQVGGANTDVGSGNVGGGTQRVVLATDQPQLTNALKVDGSAVTQPVSGVVTANAGTNLNTSALGLEATQAAVKTAVELIDDAIYTDGTGTPSKAIGIAGTDGTNPQIVKTDAAGELQVDVLSIAAGDNNIGNVDVATMPDVTLAAGTNTNEVVGDAAEDAALAGNPVRMGMRASTAIPTAMSADGDVVTPWANRSGAPVVTQAPHVGLNSDPWNLQSKTAQYTTTQTSTVLQAGGASEKLVVTDLLIQVGGTTAGTVQVYFGTGAYVRGTNRAIFDGEFAPSATLKPGVVMKGPFISGANGDDVLVTTSAAINPITITIWFYILT